MSTPQQQAPAGWYPDPEAPGRQRWWDGTAWAAPTPGTVTAPTNGLGIAGFVLGIAAVGAFTAGPLAYGLGLIGLVLAALGVSRARGTGRHLQLSWWGVGLSLAGIALTQLWRWIT